MLVVFDLGGVLASATTQISDAAAELGCSEEAMQVAYWQHRVPYDRGGSDEEYWGAIAKSCGVEITAEQAAKLGTRDAELWLQIRPSAEQILKDVNAAGVEIAILSNAPSRLDDLIDDAPWAHLYQTKFVSGTLRLIKPHPEIYLHVEEALGKTPNELCFIDDREANLVVPTERGWHTHLFQSDDDTRSWLVELGVLDGS